MKSVEDLLKAIERGSVGSAVKEKIDAKRGDIRSRVRK